MQPAQAVTNLEQDGRFSVMFLPVDQNLSAVFDSEESVTVRILRLESNRESVKVLLSDPDTSEELRALLHELLTEIERELSQILEREP